MTDKPHMTLENCDKLFEGEYGITRNGDRVGPIKPYARGICHWIASGNVYTGKGEHYYCGVGPSKDIIARAEPAIANEECRESITGTLEELGVEVGDVVEFVEWHDGPCQSGRFAYGKRYTVKEDRIDSGTGYFHRNTLNIFRIVPRAEPAISLDVLENLTTPLGLLDDATRKALEAHGGPYEWFFGEGWVDTAVLCGDWLTHRVNRPRKVETVKRSLHGDKFIGYFAIDKINGKYDPSTVRPWVEGDQ